MKNENNTDLALPVINTNGDTADTLCRQYRRAFDAIDSAIDAIQLTAPHGRNYQIGECDYQLARDEHCERIKQLQAIRKRLMTLAIHCQE